MAANYASYVPKDENGNTLQDYPTPIRALTRYTSINVVVSSVVTLTDDTTVIEITASNGPAAIRWIPATESAAVTPFASVIALAGATANYDHVIAKDTTRRFVVPRETYGNPGSIVGANVQNGLFKRVAWIGAGGIGVLSSIMASEF